MYSYFRNVIDQKGISAYRVSKDTGIPYGTLSDWKLGKSKPKVEKLKKIAIYLDIPLENLLREDGE